MPVALSRPRLVKYPAQRWVLSKSIPKFRLQDIVRYEGKKVRRFVAGFVFFQGVFLNPRPFKFPRIKAKLKKGNL